MAADGSLKTRMLAGETLVGTFVKTPAHEVIEVLARSGLDFVALDAEHAAFDRGRMDACLAIGRALGFPVLVRVQSATAPEILNALDAGAVGVVCPHIDTVEKSEAAAKAAHFGHGGRGYAGSTRWAGFATRKMTDILADDDDTLVLAQIEEPEGVDAAAEIAAIDGIDALFVGPADLSICYGANDPTAPVVREAMFKVGKAAAASGKAMVTFAPNADVADLKELGVSVFFIGSEHGFMLAGANAAAKGARD